MGKDRNYNQLFFRDLIYSNSLDNKGNGVDEETEFSLNAFNGMDERDLLPYIERIKDGDESDPTFLISSFDPTTKNENVLALKFDTEGKLRIVNTDIKEDDVFGGNTSKANPGSVYLLDSDGCGNYYKTSQGCGGSSGGGGTYDAGAISIKSFVIRDKKDSWVNNNEVRVVRASNRGISSGNTISHCGVNGNDYCNLRGDWLAQYNNSEINNGREIRPNYYLADKMDTAAPNGTVTLYSMFEYDNWPAPTNDFERTVNGMRMVVHYKSYQTPYVQEIFTTNPSVEQYGVRYKLSSSYDDRAVKYSAY